MAMFGPTSAPRPVTPEWLCRRTRELQQQLKREEREAERLVYAMGASLEIPQDCPICLSTLSTLPTMATTATPAPAATPAPVSPGCPGQLPVCLRRCKHWFHRACADKWLEDNDTCPVCRQIAVPMGRTRTLPTPIPLAPPTGDGSDDDPSDYETPMYASGHLMRQCAWPANWATVPSWEFRFRLPGEDEDDANSVISNITYPSTPSEDMSDSDDSSQDPGDARGAW